MMKDIERKFLLGVEGGDIDLVTKLLNSSDIPLDVNCCDPLARNALVIAINNENLAMVKLLIEAGIKIGDALLYAIDENFVEAVELLLDHEEATKKSGNLNSWEQDRENSPFSDDMTPLILAAHRNNFEIIKMLFDRRVSPIPDPHDTRCNCEACCLARAEDCLKHSRSRINAYRALASPCLIALSSPDPLLTAFEMSARLERLGNMEPEYKQDYLRLRAQCQTFVTKLLDHTRTSKELEILLNYSDEYLDDHEHGGKELGELCCQGSLYEMSFKETADKSSSLAPFQANSSNSLFCNSSTNNNNNNIHLESTKKDSMLSLDSVTGRHESYRSHMRLARLKLAIQCKQRTFCAHPNIQELLANMWYENLPGFRSKNPIAQIIQVLMIGMMFPIYSAAYLVAPHSQLGRYIKKPFIKFICHSASYITFLVVLTLAPASSKKRGCLPSPIELAILIWVLSLLWAEFKQIRALGINYYKEDMWNTLDSVASGFYIGAIVFRVVSYAIADEISVQVAREHWQAYDPTLLSEGLFAAATIFSALKLVYIFSVNPYLGPLQISLGRMIIDILQFSWIYILVLFSFSCGMNQLLWYYADLERHQCLNITNYSLAQYYSSQQELARHQLFNISSNSSEIGSTGAESPLNFSTTEFPPLNESQTINFLEDESKPPVTIDDSCKTWRHFSNVFESSQTLFWATFGLVDLENFDLTGIRQYTRFWALLMFGCYCFINVIVVLNLLIAMMNHSYVKISQKSDIEWKFARTRLWMSYFDTGSTVPAPFNIIPSIKSTMNLLRILTFRPKLAVCSKKCPFLGKSMCNPSQHKSCIEKRNCTLTFTYRNVMRSLIRRYLVNEQRLLERKRELTEAKLNRWAKFNAFD